MLDYVKAVGYNYNAHFCGMVIENGASSPNPEGEKLIIEFPISFDMNSPVEYLGGSTFTTNGAGSGIYPEDPDPDITGNADTTVPPAGEFAFPFCQYYLVYTYLMNNDGTYTIVSSKPEVRATPYGYDFANRNLTTVVPDGYLYAGYWAVNAPYMTTADPVNLVNQAGTPVNLTGTDEGKWMTERYTVDQVGVQIDPVTGSSYHVRCVPDTYLRPGYHITYAEEFASQNPWLPHNLYLTTGVDCAVYNSVGFNVTLNSADASSRSGVVYQNLTGKGPNVDDPPVEYDIGSMFKFEGANGLPIANEPLFGHVGVAMITPSDGSCVGDEAAISWWDNFISCVYTPFWVTPDNVKVTGVKTRTIDWKTFEELGGETLDKTDKRHLTFSPLPPKLRIPCEADTYIPDSGSAPPQLLTVWDRFMLDTYNNSPGSGEGEDGGSEDVGDVTPPAPTYDFSYRLVHSLVNRMGQRVVYNTYISTDDSDFVEIGVIVNGRTYAASRVGQAPRLANLKYNYVTSWMGYGISTVQAYKVMANGTVVYGEIQNVR